MKLSSKTGSVLTLLLIGAIVILLSKFLFHTETDESKYAYMQEHWSVMINNELYEEVSLEGFEFSKLERGDEIILLNHLPIEEVENAVLEVYSIRSDVTVKLDGVEVYSYGRDLYDTGKTVGYGYHYIDIPEDYAGMELEICMRVAEDEAFSFLPAPKVGDSMYSYSDYVRANSVPLIINIFLIVFGICGTGAGLLFAFHNKAMFQFMSISMVSLLVGIWSLCNYDLHLLFISDPRVKAVAEFYSLYMAPLFFFEYFKERSRMDGKGLRQTCYTIIEIIQIVFLVSVTLLHMFGVAHLHSFLFVEHIIMMLMVLCLFGMLLQDFMKKRGPSPVLLLGLLIMLCSVVFDIIQYYLTQKFGLIRAGHFTGITCIGTLLLVVALIIDFCHAIVQRVYDIAQAETFEKFAYMDALTGVANRRRCQEVFEKNDETKDNYVIVSMDLNNLKRINDSYGHSVGDDYLVAFSKILMEVFDEHGLVGRLGGDEFVVILKDKNVADVRLLIEQMHTKMELVNEEHPEWNMSTAYGISSSREDAVDSSHEMCRLADTRMYEMKMIMKGHRSLN